MVSLPVNSSVICSSISSSSRYQREKKITSSINLPKIGNTKIISPPDFTTTKFVDELVSRRVHTNTIPIDIVNPRISTKYNNTNIQDPMAMEKLYAIMEIVSDRIEMHKNIGEQRNNWNSLLLTSINTITLTAAIMAAISAIGANIGTPTVALKLTSTILYLASGGILAIMNKIQPSQLVEEQRNATRLFKQIYEEIHTKVTIGNPNTNDVEEAMEKVLALDKAFPLPLLGVMLEKFPQKVEPAVWWPKQRTTRKTKNITRGPRNENGWDDELENEMREVAKVMKRNDEEEYLRLGEKALTLNKMLAYSGPLLTGLAAFGSAFVGHSSWALAFAVVGGALSSVVNTMQHGGQVGMVFEMYRSNAGFFKIMEENVESSLFERRENGKLVEMKLALQLGRSLSELKDLATSSSLKGETLEEFASKLF